MKVSVPKRDHQATEPALHQHNDPYCDKERMPRFSSPMSFLGLRAFVIALAMLGFVLNTSVQAASNSTCVCDFDAGKDYFPVKLTTEHAKNFKIEYFKSYKKLTVQGQDGPVVTYAYLCGTPRPSEATAANSVQIPIDAVALSSSTFLPLVNYIGKRSSLLYVAIDPVDMPPCLGKLHQQGKVAAGYSLEAVAPQVIQMAVERSKEHPDLVFADNWDYNSIKSVVDSKFGEHTQVFRLPQSSERTPLGALEWLEAVAALYNAEPEASYVISSIAQRYNCVKNLVTSNPPPAKVKVLWGNHYTDTWSGTDTGFWLASCPSYVCDLVRDAGGELISPSAAKIDEAEALNLAQQADVWIYPDGNMYVASDTNPIFMTAERNLTFGELPVFQNNKVFDYQGSHWFDWFDSRLAEPDVLLMDLVQAFYGTTYISASRAKRFLRNVHLEPVAPQGDRDPNTCADTDAPLYTGWLSGPCSVTGTGGEGLPPAVDLCPKLGSGSAASVITPSLAALMVVLVALVSTLAIF